MAERGGSDRLSEISVVNYEYSVHNFWDSNRDEKGKELAEINEKRNIRGKERKKAGSGLEIFSSVFRSLLEGIPRCSEDTGLENVEYSRVPVHRKSLGSESGFRGQAVHHFTAHS